MAVESYHPASAKFQFKPQLTDAILETEESITLLSSCEECVETCQRKLGNFAIQAFEMNKRQLSVRLDKVLATMLYVQACKGFDCKTLSHQLPPARRGDGLLLSPRGGDRGAKQHNALPPPQELQRRAQARATTVPHPA